jgi:catechol 2,3-dioxygenase-like lactoylglutathione lyase family enzyme
MAETGTATRITKVGTVMVPVSDQDRAIEFFVEKLGFELRGDTPYGEGDRWVEVGPPGAATTVALVKPREGTGEEPGIMTRIGFDTDDVGADHATLRSRGVDVDDVLREGDPVPPMFFFRDPDGNHFMLAER